MQIINLRINGDVNFNLQMDNISKNKQSRNVSTRTSDIREEYVLPLELSGRQNDIDVWRSSVDSEIYFTPAHLIKNIDAEYKGLDNATKLDEVNKKKTVSEHHVRKHSQKQKYVQDEEDEDGYTLAMATPNDASPSTFQPSPTTVTLKEQSNSTHLSWCPKKNHVGILCFAIGFVIAGASVASICEFIKSGNPTLTSLEL